MMVFMYTFSFTQRSSGAIFSNGDRIEAKYSEASNVYFIHKMEKGQSLYAFSKVFDVPLQELYQINNLKNYVH